jgi:hypothetical protein
MVKVNEKEVEWEDPPEGFYLTDVKIKVLWKNEETGAQFMLVKIPAGDNYEHQHTHGSGQWSLWLRGEVEFPDGRRRSIADGDWGFGYQPKNTKHGTPEGLKIIKEIIGYQYFDSTFTKEFE